MSKFTLSLNSHALSSFQECESKYLYTHLIGIEPLGSKFAMDRGTSVAKFLELYYYNKIKPHPSFLKALNNPIAWTNHISKQCGVSAKEAFDIYRVCVQYTTYWKGDTWKPIAVERGFSKLLYEDDENFFLWEGRPDLIVENMGETLIVDHKTQGRTNSIYQFNNQARGYLWSIAAQKFVYNYIVFNKTPEFRREPHSFTPEQLEDWRQDTIEWFFRIKAALTKQKFLSSWQCQTQYGKCPFTLICEQPKGNIKSFVIRSQFKTRKPYRSW